MEEGAKQAGAISRGKSDPGKLEQAAPETRLPLIAIRSIRQATLDGLRRPASWRKLPIRTSIDRAKFTQRLPGRLS
jgi:hypothetical protein